MNQEIITPEKIDELLRFLPLFEMPGREFVERWGGGERTADGAITMPYPVYSEDVRAFFQLAGQPCWADYSYRPEEAGKMVADDTFVEVATLNEIKTMLTYCVRGERFCDGHWAELLRSGRVVAILERLKVLRDLME